MNSNPKLISRLGDALFSTTQQKVLGLLYGLPDESFFVNQISFALLSVKEMNRVKMCANIVP